MPKFLTTLEITSEIETILRKSNEYIVLMTPYLKLTDIFMQRLKDVDEKNIPITLIYGKSELRREEGIFLEKLKNLEILFCENLHAKCYCNESIIIISSMNLYDFSLRKNREMGVLIHKEKNNDFFEEALSEIQSIRRISKIQKRIFAEKKIFENKDLSIESKDCEKVLQQIQPLNRIIKSISTSKKDGYLELFLERLKKEYPNLEVCIERVKDYTNTIRRNVILKKFPLYDCEVMIDTRRILLWLDNKSQENFEYLEKKLCQEMDFNRYFLTYKARRLHIFPPSKMKFETDVEKIDFFCDILQKVEVFSKKK